MSKTLIDTFMKDKNGHIPFSEKPNPPLIVAFVAFVLMVVLPPGHIKALAGTIAFGAYFTWAWLELFQGSALFRRVLGALVLIIIIYLRVF